MKILCLDIAFLEGFILIEYDSNTKVSSILETGIINVKKYKSHKEYYLYEQTKALIDRTNPNLVITEAQFYRDMFSIKGVVYSAINPTIDICEIFSKRARNLAFNDGSLSKEDANNLIVKKYPELAGKQNDILDAAILFEAWRIAFETNQPLKAPKKPKKLKTPKEPKPKKQKTPKTKTKKEKPKR
jgi:hypothetical protein